MLRNHEHTDYLPSSTKLAGGVDNYE